MNCIIINSPLVQLNTPYPSGAYLKNFFKTQDSFKFSKVEWWDLSIQLFDLIFSPEGLKLIFDSSKDKALSMATKAEKSGQENVAFNLRRYIMQEESWIQWIDSIKAILSDSGTISGRELCHEFLFSPFAPRGQRMENFLTSSSMTIDDARFLASFALADLADYISTVYDENFSLIRYAETLATSEIDFSRFEKSTQAPIMKNFLEPLIQKNLENLLQESDDKFLFCISVPFAGCFASTLTICKAIRKVFSDKALISIGGGYINTELRNTTEPLLAKYTDFISYDRGYGSYIDILKKNFKREGEKIFKTAYFCKDGKFVQPDFSNTNEEIQKIEDEFTLSIFPDYEDIDFGKYPRLVDDENPMHRIWSDGSWLKAYMAHGCYWHRCAFCDTTLDYVCSYKRIDCKKLHAHLLNQAKKTGIYGIHFVDEACPPRSLVEFGIENCNTGKPLSFWGNVRFEKSFNRDMTDFLAYSGLIGVSGGIEIATGSGLEKVNKGTDFESLINACCAFKESGILVHAYMIYGFYSEKDQDTINSMEVLRQMFQAGLLDSSFWHKFMLTKHSTLFNEYKQGLHQDLVPIISENSNSWFAQNDIHFKGEEKSEKFEIGLNIALDEWMHGENLNRNVQSYFNFPVPKPSIPKDYVEQFINKYEQKKNQMHNDFDLFSKNQNNYKWLGGNVIQSGKKIIWMYFGQIIEVSLNDEIAAKKIAESLNNFEFDKILNLISGKIYRKLRENGLVRI